MWQFHKATHPGSKVLAANTLDSKSIFVPIENNIRGSLSPVAYLGGHGAMPPFGPTMKFFYRRIHMKKVRFCRFPANFL